MERREEEDPCHATTLRLKRQSQALSGFVKFGIREWAIVDATA